MFTKNLVLETLHSYRVSHSIDEDSKPDFKWIAMLPDNLDEMSIDMLYVCPLSRAIERNLKTPGYYYLAIRDMFADDEEDADALKGIIVVNENRSASWLFNIVQKRFLEISEWVNEMQSALIENCDYQRIVDLCEPILKNPVLIFDSAYTLLAHTKNIIGNDPITTEVIEKGYHSDETLKVFRDRKRFKFYEQEQKVVVSPPGVISQYGIVTKWCRFGGEMLLQVVMECSQAASSPASVDLFEIFMECVQICFERQQRNSPSHVYSSLLSDIIYTSLDNPFTIGERAKTSDIPFSGQFDAYRIVFEDNSSVLVGRFVQELETCLQKSKIVARKYEVVVLNIYGSSDYQKQSMLNLPKITPLLEKYGAMCGVSETFATLPEFRNAYIQATRAQTLGLQLLTLGNYWNFDKEIFDATKVKSDNKVFYYSDVYVHLALHMAQSSQFNAFVNTECSRALVKLSEYDRDNNTRLVQVLYSFLISQRRATAAGRILKTHRNNVLYHVSRIEEITGVDLNNYWTRLKLLLAFHLAEIQESNRLFYTPGGDAAAKGNSELAGK